MGNERLALALSLVLHALLAVIIIAMASSAAPPAPRLHLDFTLLELSSVSLPDDKASTTALTAGEAPAVTPPVPETGPAKIITPQKIEPTTTKIRRQPVAPAPGQGDESTPEAPASAPSPVPATGTVRTAPKPVPAVGTSNNVPQTMGADEAFRQANFTTIRDSIRGKLHYPLLARRRGWSGQVEISFTITPDGNIRDLRILTSSGFTLLDNEALSAIRQTAPFSPPPPVAATLTMPITFRLN